MKNNAILLLIMGLFTGISSIQGQSLKDFLNSDAVKKAVSTVVDSKVTSENLQGTWNYLKPACELKSDDLLKGAGGSVISSQLEKKMQDICSKAGITEGNFSYIFSADSTFSNILPKGKPLGGTYSYNPETQIVTLQYAIGKKLTVTTLEGKISQSGDNINLLFNADKLMKLLSLVSSITNSTTLKAVNQLASQYDGVMLGFELKK